MNEDDTGRSTTRPHPEALQIAKHVAALVKSEETGEYRKEVLLKLTEIDINQRHHGEMLNQHMVEDKEKFEKHEDRVSRLEIWQNRIVGALIFIMAIAGIVTWAIDKFGAN